MSYRTSGNGFEYKLARKMLFLCARQNRIVLAFVRIEVNNYLSGFKILLVAGIDLTLLSNSLKRKPNKLIEKRQQQNLFTNDIID